MYGHRLPDGMTPNQALDRPIITPTTKADHGGHDDEPLTEAEILGRGLLTRTSGRPSARRRSPSSRADRTWPASAA